MRGMRGGAAVALLVALLLAPGAVATPWLQFGGNAARHHAMAEPLPAHELALRVNLSGTLPTGEPILPFGQPLVMDRTAYVFSRYAILRVDLDTGVLDPWPVTDWMLDAISDGDRMFVFRNTTVTAYALDGTVLWEAPFPGSPTAAPTVINNCSRPAHAQGTIYALCSRQAAFTVANPATPGLVFNPADREVFTVAFDAATGALLWRRPLNGVEHDRSRAGGTDALGANPLQVGVSVTGGHVLVATTEYSAPYGLRGRLTSLSPATGEIEWQRLGETNVSSVDPQAPDVSPLDMGPGVGAVVLPVGAPSGAYARLDGLQLVDLATGNSIWHHDEDPDTRLAAPAIAAQGDRLVVGWGQFLRRLEPETKELEIVFDLQQSSEQIDDVFAASDGYVVVAGATIFEGFAGAPQRVGGSRPFQTTIYAVNADGELRWKETFAPGGNSATVVAAEGLVLVHRPGQRELAVLGRTGASITPAFAALDLYPAVGASTRVDLSPTAPGLMAPDLEYRADWGDGTVDDWRADPVFTHTYTAAGDMTAVFSVRNSAGQVSRETRVMQVGATPPAEPTFLERAFAAENQERTFFALGLLATGLFAVGGFLRVSARRGRLRRELHAIDEVYRITKERATECERALAERRTHIRALLVDGKLDEPQYALLERHIDGLARQLRLAAVDDELGFLSVRMAKLLRGILTDGRIDAWEKEQFLDALERDERLTPAEKEKARAVVGDWSGRDAPG